MTNLGVAGITLSWSGIHTCQGEHPCHLATMGRHFNANGYRMVPWATSIPAWGRHGGNTTGSIENFQCQWIRISTCPKALKNNQGQRRSSRLLCNIIKKGSNNCHGSSLSYSILHTTNDCISRWALQSQPSCRFYQRLVLGIARMARWMVPCLRSGCRMCSM